MRDVVEQSHDEAPHARHAGHLGIQQPPSPACRADVAFGERILLAQQVAGQQPHLQPYADASFAVHAECVDESFGVLSGVFPRSFGRLDLADAQGLEELVRTAFGVVAPHLHVVRRRRKVPPGGRVPPRRAPTGSRAGRPAAALDGLDQAADVGRVPGCARPCRPASCCRKTEQSLRLRFCFSRFESSMPRWRS